MAKINSKLPNDIHNAFSNIKAYSVNEIIAAGGTTAFADKLGKDFHNVGKRLKKLSKDAFLTKDEFNAAMKTLRDNK